MDLPIKMFPHYKGLPLLAYQTANSAGLDLAAAIPEDQSIILKPGQRMAIPTGVSIQLPHGSFGEIRPRSGCSLRDGLVAIIGTVDQDFRGQLQVIVHNINPSPSFYKKVLCKLNQWRKVKDSGIGDITITRGMRIAQLVIVPYVYVCPREVEQLFETSRGSKGFGSTGK